MYRRCTSAVWVVAVACALALTGPADVAAQTSAKKKQRVVKSADAVPSNYRALITRYFASKDGVGAKALSAQISRPGTWESPLGLGKAAPIVCVKWKVQGTFGQHGMELIFRFNNGQIYEALNPETVKYSAGLVGVMLLKSVTCDKLVYGPYPELVKRQRPKQ